MSGNQFCQYCGRQFSPTGKYCQGCGKPRLSAPTSTNSPAQPTQVAPNFVNPPQPEKKIVYKPINPNANRPTFTPPPAQAAPQAPQAPQTFQQPKESAPAKNVFVPPVQQSKPLKSVEPEVIEWKRKPKSEKLPKAEKIKKDKSERVGFNSKTPIIIGLVALLVAGGAIWYTTKPNSTKTAAVATPSPSPTASEQAAVDVPTDASPTPSTSKAPVNSACVITSTVVSHLVDYANLVRNVPGGSNDKNNAPVIIDWAQSASTTALQIASDQGSSKGKVASLLGIAANDLGDYANLILSWGQNKVESPSTFVADYTNGQKQILNDYRAIASICGGKVPSA
jgi:hypothetical protein